MGDAVVYRVPGRVRRQAVGERERQTGLEQAWGLDGLGTDGALAANDHEGVHPGAFVCALMAGTVPADSMPTKPASG